MWQRPNGNENEDAPARSENKIAGCAELLASEQLILQNQVNIFSQRSKPHNKINAEEPMGIKRLYPHLRLLIILDLKQNSFAEFLKIHDDKSSKILYSFAENLQNCILIL